MRIVIVFFLVFTLQEGTSAPLTSQESPACASFGVQRFQEKKEALPFSLKSLDGNQVTLSGLKGKPLLMVFFASWCPGCKEELPLFEKFSSGKKDQLTIIGLAIDGEKEKKIQNFVKKCKVTLPVLLDEKEKVARAYGVKMVPTTFLIDTEGFIVGMVMGQRDWSSPGAWAAIKELLIR